MTNWTRKCRVVEELSLVKIPASYDTVESEGRQIKQCWIKYFQTKTTCSILFFDSLWRGPHTASLKTRGPIHQPRDMQLCTVCTLAAWMHACGIVCRVSFMKLIFLNEIAEEENKRICRLWICANHLQGNWKESLGCVLLLLPHNA